MVRLIFEQFTARRQFVAADFGDEFDLSTSLTKRRGLVKSQLVHRDHLGRSAKGDAVPSQKPRDLQIPRGWKQANEN